MLPRVFISKVDAWLLLLMLATVLIVSVSVASQYSAAGGHPGFLMALSCPILILLVWILADTRYILESERLLVHCGPFRWTVRITEITSAVMSRDPTSGPALSLDRIRIEFGRGHVLVISPQDREAFLRTLNSLRRGGPRDGRSPTSGAI